VPLGPLVSMALDDLLRQARQLCKTGLLLQLFQYVV